MSKKLETYYEDQFSLFLNAGWKDFIEDTKSLLATMTLDSVSSEQELYFRKGQKDILNWLMQREKMHSDSYEQLLNDGEFE